MHATLMREGGEGSGLFSVDAHDTVFVMPKRKIVKYLCPRLSETLFVKMQCALKGIIPCLHSKDSSLQKL